MSKPIYLFSTSSHPDAISINSLDITFLKPEIDFSLYDYLTITSKQVSESLKQYDKQEYITKKALCVSDKTADSFRALGAEVLETAGGYGSDLESIIRTYSKKTRWLYLRAKEVANEFSKELKSEYMIDEFVVYDSKCSKDILDIEVEESSILIFTSPSSVKCFLKKNKILESHKVIVIGKTTANALPKNIKYMISKERSIDSCISLAKSL